MGRIALYVAECRHAARVIVNRFSYLLIP